MGNSTQQSEGDGVPPSPERLGSTRFYCPRCGCKVGMRSRRRTKTTYFVHELSKGHKGECCRRVVPAEVKNFSPENLRLVRLEMAAIKRHFLKSNTGDKAR